MGSDLKNGVRIIFLFIFRFLKKIILTPFFPPKNNSDPIFPIELKRIDMVLLTE